MQLFLILAFKIQNSFSFPRITDPTKQKHSTAFLLLALFQMNWSNLHRKDLFLSHNNAKKQLTHIIKLLQKYFQDYTTHPGKK